MKMFFCNKVQLLLFLPFMIFDANEVFAQADFNLNDLKWNDWIEEKLEILAEDGRSEGELNTLLADMKELAENPIDLNLASRETLGQLFFLTELQIYYLVAYRENHGALLSIYELFAIDGFDRQTIRVLVHFIFLGKGRAEASISPKKVVKYGKHMFLLRVERFLENRLGYVNKKLKDDLLSGSGFYLGSPERYLFKYRFNYSRKIALGFTAEKDPGEVFFLHGLDDSVRRNIQKQISGFDFYSAHLAYSPGKFLKKLILGDFQVYLGQGLNFWSGYGMNNSSDVTHVKRMINDFKPHTGTEENRFLRGAAAAFKMGSFESIVFVSKNSTDARYSTGSLTDTEEPSANLLSTGYHRTLSELEAKNRISLFVGGGNLQYRHSRMKLGITAFSTFFEVPLFSSSELYKRFQITGSNSIVGGMDYHILIRRINFFGEVSICNNGSIATLHGINSLIHPRFSISLLYRHYPRNYHNYFSSPFMVSHPYNESGIYAGVKVQISSKSMLQLQADNYSFPWLSYQADMPVKGRKCMISLQQNLPGSTLFSFRLKIQNRQMNQTGSSFGTSPSVSFRKVNMRFHLVYFPALKLKMQNRLEFCRTSFTGQAVKYGFLAYQDVGWKSSNNKFHLDFRYAIFYTDSFNERIYAYERDVLYAFSVPAYFYHGVKSMILFKFVVNKKISCWLRASRTWYTDRNSISSGLDAIEGNTLTNLKFQVQMKI